MKRNGTTPKKSGGYIAVKITNEILQHLDEIARMEGRSRAAQALFFLTEGVLHRKNLPVKN